LPPSLTYDDDLVLTLSRADAALSELAGLGRHLPNRHLLIAPYVRREAVLSSRIEGTRTTLSELLLDEATDGTGSNVPDDVREVRNYVVAMEYGVGRLKQARALALLDVLFANPYLSVARAEKILEVSNPTARQAVRALIDAGVLEEITGRSWGRLYLARPILRAIQGGEETL
jgi:Fic family protein